MRNATARAGFLLSGLFSLLAFPLALSACTSEEVDQDLGADLSGNLDLSKPADLLQVNIDGGQGD